MRAQALGLAAVAFVAGGAMTYAGLLASERAATVDEIRQLAVAVQPPAPKVEPTVPKGLSVETLQALRGGGHVIFVRHADRDENLSLEAFDRISLVEGKQFPEDFDVGVCLNEVGQAVGRVLGRAIELAGIPVGMVYSSPICRAVQTATLAVGRAPDQLDERLVYSTMGANESETKAISSFAEGLLKVKPERGNTFVFSHGNLVNRFGPELAGLQKMEQGGFAVFKPLGDSYELVTMASLVDLSKHLKVERFASSN